MGICKHSKLAFLTNMYCKSGLHVVTLRWKPWGRIFALSFVSLLHSMGQRESLQSGRKKYIESLLSTETQLASCKKRFGNDS